MLPGFFALGTNPDKYGYFFLPLEHECGCSRLSKSDKPKYNVPAGQ